MSVSGFPPLLPSKAGKLEVLLILPVRPWTLGEAMVPTSLSLSDSESDSDLEPEQDIDFAGLLSYNNLRPVD